MKIRATVWTLSWDTDSGTDCLVFGSEDDWFEHFRSIIYCDIQGMEVPEAVEVRRALQQKNISLAYDLWQASFKDEMDTYSWGSQEIEVHASA